jgi:murein DD-endopeptidase MepM/ murein hydrolase activator NlpD
MLKLSHKSWLFFTVALVLTSLSSCLNFQSQAQSSLKEANNVSEKVAQELTGQKVNNSGFGLPIDCKLGQDCYIMHYVDRDPSPGVVDFGCGHQTYDQHDGTDFAIANEKVMAKGVAVVAIAPGKVLRVRDGVRDRRVEDETTKKEVEGTECGNGMVIDHGNGWEAQYCHLRQGSVKVKSGTQVEKGSVLGMVGESGLASFPHVHLTLRYQGKPIDPFVGPDAPNGCNVTRKPVWDQPLAYTPTGLIQAGFSTIAPQLGDIWVGKFTETVFPVNSPALLFWVHDFGVLEGDREFFQLISPTGETIVKHEGIRKSSQRDGFSFVGKKNTEAKPLIAGIWKAQYRLTRGDKVLIDIQKKAKLE